MLFFSAVEIKFFNFFIVYIGANISYGKTQITALMIMPIQLFNSCTNTYETGIKSAAAIVIQTV